jgi:hypothetical protein
MASNRYLLLFWGVFYALGGNASPAVGVQKLAPFTSDEWRECKRWLSSHFCFSYR